MNDNMSLYLDINIFYLTQDNGSWTSVKTPADLNAVLDLASVVPDDEGGLHDGRKLDVAVPFMLPLELIQQRLIGGLREAGIRNRGERFEEQ